jgi:tetratricopeptide (TPR) repeat protein
LNGKSKSEHLVKLREGEAHLAVEDYDAAIAAYSAALKSKDAGIAARAATGLVSGLNGKSKSEHLAKLREGEAHLAVEDYDAAIAAFQVALASRDLRVKKQANGSLDKALQGRKMKAEGPQWVTPKWLLKYGLELLLVSVVLGIIWKTKYSIVRPFRGDSENRRWILTMLDPPASDFPTDVFVNEFRLGQRQIASLPQSSVLGRPGSLRIKSRGKAMDKFTAALDLKTVFNESKLSIGGFDLGVLAGIAQSVLEHFSWKLEICVRKIDGVIYAYAALRWGSQIEKMWKTPEPATSLPEAGRMLAFEVFSDGWIRS